MAVRMNTKTLLLFRHLHSLQRTLDDVIHIVVLILRQTAAEDGVLFLPGQGCILLVELLVALVVDRVIRLFAAMPVS